VTWVASGDGNRLSGPATLSTSPSVTNLQFAGTLSGSADGAQLSLTFAGSSANTAEAAECRASAHGAATPGSAMMEGTLDVTFVSCDGLDLQPPASNRLTLSRQ
jgi:hypothetical protein